MQNRPNIVVDLTGPLHRSGNPLLGTRHASASTSEDCTITDVSEKTGWITIVLWCKVCPRNVLASESISKRHPFKSAGTGAPIFILAELFQLSWKNGAKARSRPNCRSYHVERARDVVESLRLFQAYKTIQLSAQIFIVALCFLFPARRSLWLLSRRCRGFDQLIENVWLNSCRRTVWMRQNKNS